MEKERPRKAHCLVVPYPLQGHINPMLQFSKRLEHKGAKVTIATTRFKLNTMHRDGASGLIAAFETISDGFDDEGWTKAGSMEAYLDKFREVGQETLAQLIQKLADLGSPLDCILYDAFLPWALDVAKRFGLVGAAFFTQSCVVGNIYYHVHRGSLKLPLPEADRVVVPGLPALEPRDMPSFIYVHGSYPPLFRLVVDQFSNVDEADWILCNTFYDLEKEVVDWMAKLWPLRTIGPTVPSMYLDGRLQDDRGYGLSMYKPNTDDCTKWLNQQIKSSVVYVSFGSLAELGAEQMQELAFGLRDSNKPFLWVVRESEMAKLPQDFASAAAEKGLVVPWCHQLEVLEHQAMGCFVTHCGWNSTLEALSLGVPMVVMPQWSDQSTNAKYVADVWENGLRVRPDEEGIVRREVVEQCIREVMDGEKGREMRENAIKWKDVAKRAVDEGGVSDRNIEEFVAKLVCT